MDRSSWRKLMHALLPLPAWFIALVAMALAAGRGIVPAHAAEIIPSIGLTRAIHGGDEVAVSEGLALRHTVIPFVRSEIGVAYRSESRDDGHLKVKQWPVTASLYLSPVPTLYAGGGVGWYHTTLDYDNS